MMMKKFATLACIALLAACSSNDSVDLEPVELVDIENERDLDVQWSSGVGDGLSDKFVLIQPAIAADKIFAADYEGRVYAFSRDNGKKLWKTDLDEPLVGGVGLGQGRVFVSTETGELVALDAGSGEEQWRSGVTSEILSPAAGNGDVAVVQSQDGTVFAFDEASGKQRWRYDNTLPALTLRGTPAPVVADSMVYIGLASGKLQAFSATDGILQWEQRVAMAQGRSELDRVVDIDGTPLLENGILYAVSYQGRLMAVNAGTGRPLWAKDESSFQNVAAGLGYIYVTDSADNVKAYNASNGQLVWTNDTLLRRHLSAPQTFAGYVAVADFEGYVHVLNQTDGQIVARRKVDGDGVRAPMATADGVLYVLGNDGELEAIKMAE
jgi:outer membrane protein assembly factor BamB